MKVFCSFKNFDFHHLAFNNLTLDISDYFSSQNPQTSLGFKNLIEGGVAYLSGRPSATPSRVHARLTSSWTPIPVGTAKS